MSTERHPQPPAVPRRRCLAPRRCRLAGCDQSTSRRGAVVPPRPLYSARTSTCAVQRFLLSPSSLAREFTEADISPTFQANGSTDPDDPAYRALAANGFADWRLEVGGLVESADGVLARRPARHAGAEPDHPSRLRRGLELHRQVDRRPARQRPRQRQAEAGGALHRLHLRRRTGKDARRQRPLLRDDRPRGRLPPADDPRLRHERRDADRRRTARRCACGSSASSATRWRNTSCGSTPSTASLTLGRGRAVSGKTAATTGTPESDRLAPISLGNTRPHLANRPRNRLAYARRSRHMPAPTTRGRTMAKRAAQTKAGTVRWGIISTANIGTGESHPGHDEEQGARGPRDRLAHAADGEEMGEEARHPRRLWLLRGAARRSRDRRRLQSAAQPSACAADACRGGQGQARALREADRADGGRGGDAEDRAERHSHRRGLHGPPPSAVDQGARPRAQRASSARSAPSRSCSATTTSIPNNVRNMADIGGGAALRHRLLPDRHPAATSSAPSRCA